MKIKTLMREYLENLEKDHSAFSVSFLPIGQSQPKLDVPVQPVCGEWEILSHPRRLYKKFIFDDIAKRNIFLEDLLGYEQEQNHYGAIGCNGLDVELEIYTHDLNDITELDEEYARFAEQTFRELTYIVEL